VHRRIGSLITIVLLLIFTGVFAGEWEQFYNSSSIYRIRLSGDSLWCGTRGGILLFNLVDSSFVQYIDGLDFPSSDVIDVAVDSRGSVWAGFVSDGIARIDDINDEPSVEYYDKSRINDMFSDSITCLLNVGDDIYYGSTEGLGKFFENIHSRETNLSDFLDGKHIFDLYGRNDSLWVGYSNGVLIFDRRNLDFTSFPIGAGRSFCTYDGFVYCLSDSGIYRFNDGGWDKFEIPEGESIISIAAGGGEFYCASKGKVFQWVSPSWVDISGDFSVETSLKRMFFINYRISGLKDILTSITVDSSGTPWVGADLSQDRRGTYLSYYDGTGWKNKAPAQLSYSEVVELETTRDGGLWVSTKRFGISYRSFNGDWIAYTKLRGDAGVGESGLSYLGYNLALLYDSEGYLWCSAWNYDLDRIEVNDVMTFDDDVWTHYALNTGTITSDNFVKAKEDPAGNRWFMSDDGSKEEGEWGINICSADGNHWLSINPEIEPDMKGGSVFDCAFSSGGTVFLAIRGYGVQAWHTYGYSWDELSNLSDDYWTTLIGPDDLASTELNCIAYGSDGSVWLGTASGLVRYKSGMIDSFTIKQEYGQTGLIGANVYDIEFDGSGNLWVATERGLNRIAPDGTIDAFTTAAVWEDELQFTYPSSIISPLTSPGCTALEYDPVGNFMWVGTLNGLVKIDLTPEPVEMIPLDNAVLYPNPLHISRGDDELRIARISGSVDIHVYNVEGELVHEAYGVQDGDVAWDLLTLNGYQASSGVYIVKISGENGTVVKKVAVIR